MGMGGGDCGAAEEAEEEAEERSEEGEAPPVAGMVLVSHDKPEEEEEDDDDEGAAGAEGVGASRGEGVIVVGERVVGDERGAAARVGACDTDATGGAWREERAANGEDESTDSEGAAAGLPDTVVLLV